MPSLHQRLRSATAASHAALEDAALMVAFSAAGASADVHAAYLSRQWALHQAIEPELRRWFDAGFARLRLHKSDWLLQDLAALGCDIEPARIAWPAPRSRAEALGAAYVLEGATLGTRQIVKSLPPEHPGRGPAGRFLRGYDVDTGACWKAFLALLEGVDATEWPAVVAGADATFDAVKVLFSEWDRVDLVT